MTVNKSKTHDWSVKTVLVQSTSIISTEIIQVQSSYGINGYTKAYKKIISAEDALCESD
ncbi:hypothetical protein [Peribacillus butanolivorans]